MTEPWSNEVVHQAFFGWSHDAGAQALLASSFQRSEDTQRWLQRLQAHIRLQPSPGIDMPPYALSYLEYDDGSVAILRRVGIGHSSGRNNSHALIGSATTLGVPVALGAGMWTTVWQDEPPPNGWMEPIHTTFFSRAAAEKAALRLRPMAEQFERELCMVLARLLDNPRAPLSIIGCPDEDRLALVWGLREAADNYLRNHLGIDRSWSFSTYEDRHDVTITGLPAIVFLPAKPGGAAPVHRTIVEFDREQPVSPNATLAGKLVAGVLHGTPLPTEEPALAVAAHSSAGFQDVPVQEQRSTPQRPRGEPRPPTYRTPQPEPPHQGWPHQRYATQNQQPVPVERKLVAALLRAETVEAFNAALHNLEVRAPSLDPITLRAELDIGAMNTAARFVEIRAREEIFWRLLKLAYGPKFEDLAEDSASKHAAKLVKNSESEQLAKMLSKVGLGNEQIRDAGLKKWTTDAHAAKLIPTVRGSRILRSARRSVYLPAAVVFVVGALLATAFLLGLYAGRPAPAQQRITDSLVTGRVTITPGENRIVFSFVKLEDKFYPQASCKAVTGNWVWQCSKFWAPQGEPGKRLEFVAIIVPQDQERRLITLSKNVESIQREDDWGQELPVS